jgi:hypothetical protein
MVEVSVLLEVVVVTTASGVVVTLAVLVLLLSEEDAEEVEGTVCVKLDVFTRPEVDEVVGVVDEMAMEDEDELLCTELELTETICAVEVAEDVDCSAGSPEDGRPPQPFLFLFRSLITVSMDEAARLFSCRGGGATSPLSSGVNRVLVINVAVVASPVTATEFAVVTVVLWLVSERDVEVMAGSHQLLTPHQTRQGQ